MLDPNNLNFEKLGFQAGIEVHHQIKSKRKLFCHCPLILEDDPENMDYSFYRYFRPVLGEMGDFDPGMLVEFEKGYKVIYYACEHNTCTYEMDETPPFSPDPEAIMKGYILAAYFNCTAFAEELVVNRKQYLDGSITTGFQRTFISGRDGWVPLANDRKVRISNVYIEEDAARRVNWTDTASRTVYFNLDRLGFPLTEIITDHLDINTPEDLLEVAKQIGRVLRLSGIGRRGSGSARQDVNISISGGDRVEIKGVQDLKLFDKFCRHEVVRQHALIEIKDEMHKRGIKKEDFQHTYIDISHLFEFGEKKVFATVFPNMKGLFGVEVQPNKDFGLDIFDKSMLISGIHRENQFHSDELEANAVRKRSKYPSSFNINDEKYQQICSILKPKSNDVFIITAGPERKAIHALKKIVERVKMALDGVPQETRRLLPDGNTEFLRVIHGKERIYPDTDTPPIVISLEKINEYKKMVGKRPWEVFDDLNSKYNFTQNKVDLLIRDEQLKRFYSLTENRGINGHLAYRLLINIPREWRRKGLEVSNELLEKIGNAISEKILIAQQINNVLNKTAENPEKSFEEILDEIKSVKHSDEEIEEFILSFLSKYNLESLKIDEINQKIAVTKITGFVLEKSNYSREGKYIAEKVIDLIKRGSINEPKQRS